MKKRILSAVLALAMIFTALVPVISSASGQGPNGTETVSIHKLLLSETDLAGWDVNGPNGYDGSQNLEAFRALTGATQYSEIAGVYFALMDAAGENYLDANGNEVDNVDAALGGLTVVVEGQGTVLNMDVTNLPAGSYSIHEISEKSTYVGAEGATLTGSKAVPIQITLPFYQENGNLLKTVHVYPKNSEDAPETEKTFGNTANDVNGTESNVGTRTYNIGDVIPYTVTTTIPGQTTYRSAVWSDTMDFGLTFNRDLAIAVNGTALEAADYTIYQTDGGFRVSLTTLGLAKINTEAEVTVTLNYTATLNEEAQIAVPEENNVIFKYGNTPDEQIVPQPITPENGQITVNKTWADAEGNTMTPPAGVSATFSLFYADGTRVPGQRPVEWTVGQPFPVWTNLDPARQYIVIEEEIAGYSAEYLAPGAGVSNIRNTVNENPSDEPEPVEVVTGGKKFIKQDGTTGEALAGAQFVVTRTVGENKEYLAAKPEAQTAQEIEQYNAAQTAYLEAVEALNTALAAVTDENPNTEAIEAARAQVNTTLGNRNTAYAAVNMEWIWVTNIGQAFTFTSGTDGSFEVRGLAYSVNGVQYHLEEIEAPPGYAQLTTPIPFTVDAASYNDTATDLDGHTALNQLIIENNRVTIPQTGGIGTIIFIIAGLAIMGTAVVVMKKRQELDV